MRAFAPLRVDRKNVMGDILRGLRLLEEAQRASVGVAGSVLTDSLQGFDGAQGLK